MVSPGRLSPLRVLVLAPHPYFVVRGTPIDLDLVLRVLSERGDTEVDVLVYGEGEPRSYPRVRILRGPRSPLLRTGPGFSFRKLANDLPLFLRALMLAASGRYDVVHAGEEAVFCAMAIRALFGTPYVYDLDSSIAQQLVEARPGLASLSNLFDRLEARAIRGASLTLPVCHALGDLCRARGAEHVVTLHDISQLDPEAVHPTGELREISGGDGLIVLYVGNLAAYQGVDLLLEGFAVAARSADLQLFVVGGSPEENEAAAARAETLGVAERSHWLPPRPLEGLGQLLAEADILAAPRISGVNTPMKVFPYLHSGRPVILTRLPTHTQLLDERTAMLAEPTREGIAEALIELAEHPELREQLGASGRRFVEMNHTYPAHRRRLNGAYDALWQRLGSKPALNSKRAINSSS